MHSIAAINWRVVLLLVLAAALCGCGATRWEAEDVPRGPATATTRHPTDHPPRITNKLPARQKTVSGLLNEYYANWRGTPYRFGGTTRKGIDCSAFTQQAMNTALGIRLPRTTALQLRQGRSISVKLVRPGDLVFFKTGDTLNHVGVMMGPSKFMHASTKNGVTISRTDDKYWSSRLIGFRRVLD